MSSDYSGWVLSRDWVTRVGVRLKTAPSFPNAESLHLPRFFVVVTQKSDHSDPISISFRSK